MLKVLAAGKAADLHWFIGPARYPEKRSETLVDVPVETLWCLVGCVGRLVSLPGLCMVSVWTSSQVKA